MGRKPREGRKCPRCQRWITRRWALHQELCQRVPLGAKLAELHEQGFTWREIADEFGVSLTFVYERAQRVDETQGASTMTCDRCGMEINRVAWGKHRGLCLRLPTPAELLAEYEAGDVTIQDLRDKYRAGFYDIVNRLDLARGEDADEQLLPAIGPACIRCGVRLDHPLVERQGMRCAWCVAEVNGERPYLEASLPAVFVGVPA